MSRHWGRGALSHELAICGIFRRALLRNNTGGGCHRSSSSRVDMGRLTVRSACTQSAIPLFERGRHHSSVPTIIVKATAHSGRPGRPNGRREAALPWMASSTVACSSLVGIAVCAPVAALLVELSVRAQTVPRLAAIHRFAIHSSGLRPLCRTGALDRPRYQRADGLRAMPSARALLVASLLTEPPYGCLGPSGNDRYRKRSLPSQTVGLRRSTEDGKGKAPPSAGRMWLAGLTFYQASGIAKPSLHCKSSAKSMRREPSASNSSRRDDREWARQ